MSYHIELVDKDGNMFKLDKPLVEGGNQEVGGNTTTWLYVTYNYSWYYYQFLDKRKGIGWLYGKKAKDCIERLEKAIMPLERHTRYIKDYWADTPGNCIVPLRIFLEWCRKFPEGVFNGD